MEGRREEKGGMKGEVRMKGVSGEWYGGGPVPPYSYLNILNRECVYLGVACGVSGGVQAGGGGEESS